MKALTIILIVFLFAINCAHSQRVDKSTPVYQWEKQFQSRSGKFKDTTIKILNDVKVSFKGDDLIVKPIYNRIRFQIDTVRNPNNNYLYYYFDAGLLGYDNQYMVKMERDEYHLSGRVNGIDGFIIWCLENWEYYTDSLEQAQRPKVKLNNKSLDPK